MTPFQRLQAETMAQIAAFPKPPVICHSVLSTGCIDDSWCVKNGRCDLDPTPAPVSVKVAFDCDTLISEIIDAMVDANDEGVGIGQLARAVARMLVEKGYVTGMPITVCYPCNGTGETASGSRCGTCGGQGENTAP